jgi:hypothetical protein
LLEPHLQSILLRFFWKWDLENYLPRLTSNLHPPELSLPIARITGVSHWRLAFFFIFETTQTLQCLWSAEL